MINQFFQACAATLLAVVLILTLRGQGRDFGLLVSIFVCCALGAAAVAFFSPVMDFLKSLQSITNMDSQMFSIILKVVGIAVLAELASLVCSDAGNGAMGKGLQYLAVAVIMWLSLPLFRTMMDLIEGMLGNL